ncbi:lipocalin family protein [Enterovibrio sp. ZSDZ35]|uniref:Outer membrane lipoprotein Blc n=1 Tax=Enterovibrio qingdaonensis TaxID=2899818 RepID=A0ABT5QRP6_9GAMM|nr:lipocalin family protein [Enterovibrio sp. ZSDZ35]MDD1783650.1 lipocalin family protein [Enterovibrio sp. ZSDZ35]
MYKRLFILFTTFALAACQTVPDGITPVAQFEKSRFLGEWYEIARLDHSFENGLSEVTAQYVARTDGGIDVINRGFKQKDNAWTEAIGRAYFVEDTYLGHLKVSFFGPFYSSYVVFELGEDYEYAFVSGYSKDYLWLLARRPTVSNELLMRFLRIADEKGFDVEEIILSQ